MSFFKTPSALFISGLILLLQATCASAQPSWSNNHHSSSSTYQQYNNRHSPISIEVIDDRGRNLAKHQRSSSYKNHRAYLEAKKGQHYRLRVRNRTNKRIAVVIAVDGRNIISGKKSHLKNTERMYVLGPYKTGTYSGWRTGKNKVNRFYFTSSGDSYAAAWGDHSAMGVIAAAVYEERPHYNSYSKKRTPRTQARRGLSADDTGTGFGEEEYSASVRVTFRPKASVEAQYFYKYQWRETLCKRGIIHCNGYYQNNYSDNRFWPSDRENHGGFALPPPHYH